MGNPRQSMTVPALRATVSPLIRGGHVPKHRLFRPISMTWPRVADGFDKTAETASHFVGAFSRSPAQPVNMKANNRATILIGAIHENKSYRSISTASCRLAKRVHQKTRELVFVHLAYAHRNALPSSRLPLGERGRRICRGVTSNRKTGPLSRR